MQNPTPKHSGEAEGIPGKPETLATARNLTVHADPAKPVSVLIVEDSALVRERLVAQVGSLPQTVIVGEASEGHLARVLFEKHRPDVVILDIELPGIHGLDLLPQFKEHHPGCVIMVLTTYAFQGFRERCNTLGADFFFDKAREFERVTEVLSALGSRRAGECPV